MPRSLIIVLLMALANMGFAQDEALNVMTFNIRFANPDDGYNYWPNRQEMVASMIRYHEADIVGLQEALRSQLDDLVRLLPEYEWYGVCRTDGSTQPNPDNEFSAILFRKDRLEFVEGSTFWLSEKPQEIGSGGWDAALPRIATWGRFRDKNSDQVFYHFNTHFDHRGERAREESARLILAEIEKRTDGGAPVVLTGDFNCTPTEAPYQVITDAKARFHLKDALFLSRLPHHGPLSTWSGFQFPGVPGRRIDYIFVNDKVVVLKHAILSDSWSGRFPSDHLPVVARVVMER